MEYQEREVKFYVRDLDALANRLQATGADLVRERVFERNLRMDTQDGQFERAQRVLRIRQDDRVRVTYKDDSRLEDGVLTRTEIEITTDSLPATRKLFEALGYQVTVIYEKYRRTYHLGDVEVVLDELPFGNFVEIEAPSNTLIEGVAQMVGLDWAARINLSYMGLFAAWKQNTGLAFKDLTFEAFIGQAVTAADLGVRPAD